MVSPPSGREADLARKRGTALQAYPGLFSLAPPARVRAKGCSVLGLNLLKASQDAQNDGQFALLWTLETGRYAPGSKKSLRPARWAWAAMVDWISRASSRALRP